MANISLSHVEAKAMKFLEDSVKKSSKKPVLKAARKGKAPSKEVRENTIFDGDKVLWTTFRDKLDISRESMLMAWMKKPI